MSQSGAVRFVREPSSVFLGTFVEIPWQIDELFPEVDGMATSFDALYKVRLAAYGLPLLEAAGLTASFRGAVLGDSRQYIV